MAKYELKFMPEYGAGCLWAVNDTAIQEFDYAVDWSKFPLSKNLQCLMNLVETYYDTSMDWKNAPDKGPWWTKEDAIIVKQKAKIAYEQLCKELGTEYKIVFHYCDPDE